MKKLISIIFLDIDGVLTLNEEEDDRILPLILSKGHTSSESIPCLQYDQIILNLFDEEAVYNLELLIAEAEEMLQHEVGIVLSSDWRINRTVPFLRTFFEKYSFASKIVESTPQLLNASREEEIMFWLKDKSLVYLSNPTSPIVHSFTPPPVSPQQLAQPYLSTVIGGISREDYDIHSFVIIDDHDSAFSNHFPDQFVHTRELFKGYNKDQALLVLKDSFTRSPKAMETILTFQPEQYTICEEEFESLDNLSR